MGSKAAFIRWWRDSRFRAGRQLRVATKAVRTSPVAASAAPSQQHPAKKASLWWSWNTLGARRNGTRATERGTGRIPPAPISGRNWATAATKAIRYTAARARVKNSRLSR